MNSQNISNSSRIFNEIKKWFSGGTSTNLNDSNINDICINSIKVETSIADISLDTRGNADTCHINTKKNKVFEFIQ